jgi:hypothetical protein
MSSLLNVSNDAETSTAMPVYKYVHYYVTRIFFTLKKRKVV